MKKITSLSILLLFTQFIYLGVGSNSYAISNSCGQIPVSDTYQAGNKTTTLNCLIGKGKITIENIKGPAIINVFGSWCEPCRQELPLLKRAFHTGQIRLVGIDVDEVNKTTPIKFIKTQGINWPVLFDPNDATKAAFGPGVPVTWYINNKSQVVYKHIGVITSYAQLRQEIKEYLGIKLK